MIIKFKYLNLLLLVFIIILAAKCDNNADSVLGIPITDYYDSCYSDEYYMGEMLSISDPNNKFFITLPYDWDLRENYSDTVYGLQCGNFMSIPIEQEKRMFLMLSGYNTELALEEYYLNELKILKKDGRIKLEETGKTMINGVDAYWVRFVSNEAVYHLVVYIKHPNLNDVYLIQASVYHPDEYKLKLCYLKNYINSFELSNID